MTQQTVSLSSKGLNNACIVRKTVHKQRYDGKTTKNRADMSSKRMFSMISMGSIIRLVCMVNMVCIVSTTN